MADGTRNSPPKANNDLSRMVAMAKSETKASTYQVGPLEAHEGPGERLTTRLTQAQAMVSVISTEEGGAAFATLNDVIQREFLWALHDLLSAARIDAALALDEGVGNG